MDALEWDDSRCDELDQLAQLVREVSNINRGSHCLDRIARCIARAEALDKTDYDSGRGSFLRFLAEVAVSDRKTYKDAKAKEPGA